MESVYLLCLIVAGGIALLSAFGDFLDLGVDADTDLDLDLDFDGGGEFADLADAGDVDLGAGSAPSAAIFSLRSIIFALFGFGAAGTALTTLGVSPTSPLTVALAVGAGLSVGAAVGALLAYLKRSDTRSRPGDEGYRGLTGRVVLPLRVDSPGRVVVRRGPREHSVRALPHPAASSDPDHWTRVVVVEMRNGIAYVGPLEEDEEELLP